MYSNLSVLRNFLSGCSEPIFIIDSSRISFSSLINRFVQKKSKKLSFPQSQPQDSERPQKLEAVT